MTILTIHSTRVSQDDYLIHEYKNIESHIALVLRKVLFLKMLYTPIYVRIYSELLIHN